MANNPKLSAEGANAATNGVTALLNSGWLDVYDGTQPATADTAITTQVKLAKLGFGATAFGSSVAGVATANAITNATVLATGTASWFRAWKSNETAPVFDGSVGTSGADLNLNSTALQINATVSVSAMTYTSPEA